jgi:hypothetical protein
MAVSVRGPKDPVDAVAVPAARRWHGAGSWEP